MKTLLVIGLLALLIYLGMNATKSDEIKMDSRTVSMEPAPSVAPPTPEPKSFTVIIEEEVEE